MLDGSWHAGTAGVGPTSSSVAALLSFLPETSSVRNGRDDFTGEEAREAGCLVPDPSDVFGAIGSRAGMAGQERLVVVGGREGGTLAEGEVVLVLDMFSLEGIEGREAELG